MLNAPGAIGVGIGYACRVIPGVAPPIWPEVRPGRFAHTIVANTPELGEDAARAGEVGKCRVALLGVPDDTGVELNRGRMGAAGGPHAFRVALANYGVASPADSAEDGTPPFPRVFDAGDVIPGSTLDETHERVTRATTALLDRNLLPICIGGGHDLTFPFVRAVAGRFGPLDGVYFDAHLDVRPEPGSGMPFRALMEGGHADRLSVVGLNPLANTREHAAYFASRGGRVLSVSETGGRSTGSAPLFCSLDMDVFDGAYAPGVSAINPAGLMPREVAIALEALGATGMLRCFDIMELNPRFDPDGRTARLAAHMFLTVLRGLSRVSANALDDGGRR